MTSQILVAKYVPDIRRWEPRNIGVVVVTDEAVRSRFLGLTADGTIDRRRIPFALSADVYQEWIRYWQACIDGGREAIERAIHRSRSSYLLAPAGEVTVGNRGADVDELVDLYYRELVRNEESTGGPMLDVLANRVLRDAGVNQLPSFMTNYRVPAARLSASEEFRFHYAWKNGRQTVAHRVTFLDADVVDAVQFRFEHLPDDYLRIAMFRGRDRSVAQSNILANLESLATLVVDVEDQNAPRRIRDLSHQEAVTSLVP